MKNKKIILFCFLISLFILLITSKSSPLYPFNDWCDANAFFTMGKSLFNGKIIFKEVFEQKGPFLYLIYGLGYLISNTTFLGVFILEVLSSTIFLYFTHKIVNLYLAEKYTFIILPIFALLIYTAISFRHGSSCEEFCFPMLMYTIYELLKYARTKEISYLKIYIVGFMAGLIFLTKYTALGISFAFMLCLFISLLKEKNIKKAFISPFVYLAGMFSPLIPWLIYFAINDAVYEFFNVYIFVNLFGYTNATANIFKKLIDCFYFCLRNIYANKLHIFLLFIVFAIYLLKGKQKTEEKLFIASALICSILFIYIGGIYLIYYVLPILIFLIFPLIYITTLLKDKIKINKLVYSIFIVLILTLSYFMSPNTYMLSIKKNDLVQYKFKKIIMKEKNPTILNYGFVDMGFYTVTGIVPNTKYFEKLNFKYDKYPENVDELNKYIENKEIDFVIYTTKGKIDYPVSEYLNINYEIVEEELQNFEGVEFKYTLYKLKEEL